MPEHFTPAKDPGKPQGDSGSCFAAVLENRDRIYGYIASLLPARQDAEDVFQQTCLVLWEKTEQFDPSREFLPWVFGVARNEVRRFIRKNSKERLFFNEALLESIATAAADRAAADRANEVDRSDMLEGCLARLSKRQQAVIRESYCGLRPIKEVASELGVSPQALYMRLHRLRQILLDCMRRCLTAE